MSMYEQAEKLRLRFESMFNEANIKQADREAIIDIVIRFGQVVKFRCRNNTAYKNFLNSTFKGLAEIREYTEERDNSNGFTKLKANVET